MPRYTFFTRSDRVSSKFQRFSDKDEARRFLHNATSDFDTLNDLRLWANDQGFLRRDDTDLVDYAAAYLVFGDLRVARYPLKLSEISSGGTTEETAGEAEDRTPLTNSADRATPSALRRPRTDPAPAASPPPKQTVVDINTQIAALIAAAQSGAPFCEQCQKANARAAK